MEKAPQNYNIFQLNFEIFYFGYNNRREKCVRKKKFWVFGISGEILFGNLNSFKTIPFSPGQ